MINYRIITRIFSQILIIEGLFMLVTAGVSLISKEPASPFLFSAIITLVTGILVFTPLRYVEKVYGTKEGFIIVTGSWLILSLFGTLPFIFSGAAGNFTDAFFESISGFTTTAASTFTDRELLSNGILFWRSIIQWIGGFGVIALSLSVIPVVKNLNIQLTTVEFSGQLSDKVHPQAIKTIKRLIIIYFLVTLVEAIFLVIGGMGVFDAICHSFSTMSTGGFSTRDEGIAAFSSPFIRVVLIVFMFIAGSNLTLVFFSLRSDFRKITSNSELRGYLFLCVMISVVVSAILLFSSRFSPGQSFLEGTFQVISIITTTGFYTSDYNSWGNLLILILFILMFTGGMSGSASGSIKILRLFVITKNIRYEVRRLIHPNAFLPIRVDKRNIPGTIVFNLLVFFTLYLLTICMGTLIISFMGYDIITSFSTSASMLGNIGPGLGTFGPFSDFSGFPVAGKWVLSILMLLGRLELFAVIILFSRSFYKR